MTGCVTLFFFVKLNYTRVIYVMCNVLYPTSLATFIIVLGKFLEPILMITENVITFI